MRWIAWGTCLVLALAGCDRSQEAVDTQSCSLLCQCFADPTDEAQAECVGGCLSDLAPVDQACQLCISENADRCAALEGRCLEPCVGPQPDPDPTEEGFPQ